MNLQDKFLIYLDVWMNLKVGISLQMHLIIMIKIIIKKDKKILTINMKDKCIHSYLYRSLAGVQVYFK